MTPWRTADVLDEVAELLTQGNKHLVFVFDGLCVPVRRVVRLSKSCKGWPTVEEGDEFLQPTAPTFYTLHPQGSRAYEERNESDPERF